MRDKSPEDVAREQREQEQLRDFEVWARNRETAYWEDKVRRMEERRAAAAAAAAGQSPEGAPGGMP